MNYIWSHPIDRNELTEPKTKSQRTSIVDRALLPSMSIGLPNELLEHEIVPQLSPISLLNLIMSNKALYNRIDLPKVITQYNTWQKTLIFTEWSWRNFLPAQLISLLPKTLIIGEFSVYEEIYLYLRFNGENGVANLLYKQRSQYNIRVSEFFSPLTIPVSVFRYLRTIKNQKEFLPYSSNTPYVHRTYLHYE